MIEFIDVCSFDLSGRSFNESRIYGWVCRREGSYHFIIYHWLFYRNREIRSVEKKIHDFVRESGLFLEGRMDIVWVWRQRELDR